ncbi:MULTISPECIES: DUF6584 family protein [Microbacterium]|uniref:DUF6584 family protein n=1 Tax=Microbacterium TaxID=33882 RepID=UPI00344E485F
MTTTDAAGRPEKPGRLSSAARPLRHALERSPHDTALRSTLIELYREGGARDQAGRYAVATPDADPRDVTAYLRWAIAQGADEKRVREFSLLDDDATLPDGFAADLSSGNVRMTPAERWADRGETAMFIGLASLLVALVATFAAVTFWASVAPFVAHLSSRLTALAWGVSFAAFAVASWLDRNRRAAAVKGAASVAFVLIGVTGLISLATSGP